MWGSFRYGPYRIVSRSAEVEEDVDRLGEIWVGIL